MTLYVVLFKAPTAQNNATPAADGWKQLVKQYEASSDNAAVRAAAADQQKPGAYVAIPARSFDPVKIEIETNPRVKVVKP